jgi:hypothetical protein
MLVAHARSENQDQLLFLGLSAENRARLRLGSAIDLHLSAVHGPLQIVIFAGETEDAMQAELFALINAATTVIKLEVS